MFSAVALGASCYPYQPADGSCAVYQAVDIVAIYTALAAQKTAQLTYYHQLKDYVGALETVAEVDAVVYGQALIGEYPRALQHGGAGGAAADAGGARTAGGRLLCVVASRSL